MRDEKRAVEFYKQMVKIRLFEEKAIELFKNGVIGGSIHPSIGQEAVAVGVSSQLKKQDYITTHHRGHGHMIAKGIDINKMMAELLGKENGSCHGRGGSMHIADVNIGLLNSTGIVGSSIPIAVGVAYRNIYKNEDRVVACVFGDGAVNSGSFHEGLNMAALWKLPVIFVCENNMWAISTKYTDAVAGKNISSRAKAYGMPFATVDGNDVFKVSEEVKKAVNRARSGNGPTLIECKTYRLEGHFVGDPLVYRSKEEAEEWKGRCPIKRLKNYLLEHNILKEEDVRRIEEDLSKKIEEAVEYAKESDFPPVKDIKVGLYSDSEVN